MGRLNTVQKALLIALVALSYLASGLFGLTFAIEGTNATPLWPPAGIAVAAMVTFGLESWIGILAGAFLTNMLQFLIAGNVQIPLAVAGSLVIACGNLLEALVVYYLCSCCMGKDGFLREVNCVFKMVPIAAIGCFFAAAIGSLTMLATGQTSLEGTPSVFVTWWLGDGLAVLVLTPFLNTFWPLPKWNKDYRWLELLCACLCLSLLCVVVFAFNSSIISRTPMFLPVLVWLAFRFTKRELLTAVVLISLAAIYATQHGTGPFASKSLTDSILAVQIFCANISMVMLILSLMVSKNTQYRESLQKANEHLEAKVAERTMELEKQTRMLKAINNQLIVEARERSAAEKKLKELEAR